MNNGHIGGTLCVWKSAHKSITIIKFHQLFIIKTSDQGQGKHLFNLCDYENLKQLNDDYQKCDVLT